MDLLSVTLALFFLVVSYVLFDRYIQNDNFERITNMGEEPPSREASPKTGSSVGGMAIPSVNGQIADPAGDDTIVKEVVYTQDYYPWWRTTRWWNYDGYLYNMPYYNYWRRPSYNNYWTSGRPLVVDGKIHHHKNFQ